MTGRVHRFGLRVIAAKKEIKEARRVKALATSVFWTDLKYVLVSSCEEIVIARDLLEPCINVTVC
jgi:hypothetical protein